MTEANLDERFAAAHRCYSKLPRSEVDYILTLLERGRLRERDLLGRSVKRLMGKVWARRKRCVKQWSSATQTLQR
jgi:hypothetical protein